MYIYIYVAYIYICTYIYVYIYIYIHLKNIYMYIYIYVYIYIYIYISNPPTVYSIDHISIPYMHGHMEITIFLGARFIVAFLDLFSWAIFIHFS